MTFFTTLLLLLGEGCFAAPPSPVPSAASCRLISESTLAESSPGEASQRKSSGVDFSNLRWEVDLSSRTLFSTRAKDFSFVHAIGVDFHLVLSGTKGDIGTLVLQPYLTRIDDVEAPPSFFDDGDDWELVFRIFNFNYTGLGSGLPHFRVGRFEIPYGTEQLVDTNGTLQQTLAARNVGVKGDWGITVNGETSALEYEVGLSRGSGQRYVHDEGSYLLSGRVGTPRDRNLVVGLSAMHGEILSTGAVALWRQGLENPSAEEISRSLTRRTRLGIDVQGHRGPFRMVGELSLGRDYSQNVLNSLFEMSWNNPAESAVLYLQLRSFMQRFDGGWDDALAIAVGARMRLRSGLSLSLQHLQNLSRFRSAPTMGVLALQVRYRR